jgi:hypothetical protein
MSQEIFDATKVIDREAEKEIFYELLKFRDDARVLTIQDTGGKGKTSYLKRLKHECRNHHEIPAAIIQLEQLQDASPFSLVSEIRKELDLDFPRFDALNKARLAHFFTLFADLHKFAQGMISIDQSTVSGSYNQFVGMHVDKLEIYPSPDWTSPEQEEIAREECIKTFFSELKNDHRDQPLVILLDTFERCDPRLHQWVQDRFLRVLCFDIKNRPQRLVVVLAGRNLPDFKDLLGSTAKYDQHIRTIKSFGTWEENRVQEFLKVHGHETLTQDEIRLICDGIKTNRYTLSSALNLAHLFIKGE